MADAPVPSATRPSRVPSEQDLWTQPEPDDQYADVVSAAFAYLDGEKASGVTLPGWWAKQVSIYQTAELGLGALAPGEHTLHVEVRRPVVSIDSEAHFGDLMPAGSSLHLDCYAQCERFATPLRVRHCRRTAATVRTRHAPRPQGEH